MSKERYLKACLFDLDGVIVDTAKYHYLAWKKIADKLGVPFTEEHNELLKGVSRIRSLEIILGIGRLNLSEKQKELYAGKKNEAYLEYIYCMTEDEILPGVRRFISELRSAGILVALGSASKNARLILQRLNLENLFDAVIDGTLVLVAKPDPEVFLRGAEALSVKPSGCVVFEDAVAGIEAARDAGMLSVGVGDRNMLKGADLIIPGFNDFFLKDLKKIIII